MANRWQKNVKIWVYRLLEFRDGPGCFICGKLPKKGKIHDIDHADNDKTNDDPENLHLLCHSCNCKKRDMSLNDQLKLIRSYSAKNVCVSECDKGFGKTAEVKELVGYRKGSPEMFANACFENQFREWILKEVKGWGSYSKQEAMATGAELVGCSPVTIGRYITKLISDAGPLELGLNSMNIQILRLKEFYQASTEEQEDINAEIIENYGQEEIKRNIKDFCWVCGWWQQDHKKCQHGLLPLQLNGCLCIYYTERSEINGN